MKARWFAGLLIGLTWSAPLLAQPDPANDPAAGGAAPAPDPQPEPEPAAAPEPEPAPETEPDPQPVAKPAPEPEVAADAAAVQPEAAEAEAGEHRGGFAFGTYGRVVASTDARGRPARNGDIVAWGSRLDHGNYVELEMRREDHWDAVDADTRVVATLAFAHPQFHWDGEFQAAFAVRNMFIEERDLGLKGLSLWAGSRMLRGDDIYVLDFWPLDNLNTIGAGLRFDAETHTSAQIHFGVAQPNNGFFVQEAQRPEPLNQFGAATVKVLDRLRYTGSAKLEQLMFFGDQGAGMKLAGYGEVHQVPAGQRETDQEQVFETLPHENGWVVGGQIGAFTGKRNTHVNLFARYARGIAAYGEFENPQGLDADMSVNDAHEMRVAAGGNFEVGPFTMMVAGYLRSFRNASGGLDFGDLDEGIVIARPHIFFTDWLGLALEGSFQAQQRGVLIDDAGERGEVGDAEPSPLFARIGRVAAIPFVTLGGRGSYSRPMFWFTYMATFRDEDARALYPVGDVLRNRKTDHFIGITAEWWFGSTSYGGTWK